MKDKETKKKNGNGKKKIEIMTSNRQKNDVLGRFNIPYRTGKEIGEIIIRVGKPKKTIKM